MASLSKFKNKNSDVIIKGSSYEQYLHVQPARHIRQSSAVIGSTVFNPDQILSTTDVKPQAKPEKPTALGSGLLQKISKDLNNIKIKHGNRTINLEEIPSFYKGKNNPVNFVLGNHEKFAKTQSTANQITSSVIIKLEPRQSAKGQHFNLQKFQNSQSHTAGSKAAVGLTGFLGRRPQIDRDEILLLHPGGEEEGKEIQRYLYNNNNFDKGYDQCRSKDTILEIPANAEVKRAQTFNQNLRDNWLAKRGQVPKGPGREFADDKHFSVDHRDNAREEDYMQVLDLSCDRVPVLDLSDPMGDLRAIGQSVKFDSQEMTQEVREEASASWLAESNVENRVIGIPFFSDGFAKRFGHSVKVSGKHSRAMIGGNLSLAGYGGLIPTQTTNANFRSTQNSISFMRRTGNISGGRTTPGGSRTLVDENDKKLHKHFSVKNIQSAKDQPQLKHFPTAASENDINTY
jgi:hypothetical protein